jgi:hypothetical protein
MPYLSGNCHVPVKRLRLLSKPLFLPYVLQDFQEWRDPKSNRGHHDFQLGLVRFRVFLRVSPSAYLSLIRTSYDAPCFTLLLPATVKLLSIRTPASSLPPLPLWIRSTGQLLGQPLKNPAGLEKGAGPRSSILGQDRSPSLLVAPLDRDFLPPQLPPSSPRCELGLLPSAL